MFRGVSTPHYRLLICCEHLITTGVENFDFVGIEGICMMTSSYIHVLQCVIPWKVPSFVSCQKNTHVEGTTNSCSLLLLVIMLETTDIKFVVATGSMLACTCVCTCSEFNERDVSPTSSVLASRMN